MKGVGGLIPVAILIGQGIMESVARPFAPWFPWQALPSKLPLLAGLVAQGDPLPTLAPVFSVLCLSLAFVLLAIWRFEREEF